jgi:hypothetical protein
MRNLDCLSAEKLLSITSPESLFSASPSQAKQEYRALALRWHPDNSKTKEAVSVFAHIVHLWQQAQMKLSNGTWDEPFEKAEQERNGIKAIRLKNGSVKTIDYLSMRPFELGTMYIGNHHITFQVGSEFSDLYDNGRRQIHSFSFQDDAMCLEMANYLPQILDAYKTKSACFLELRKTPDQLLLSDVLKHFSNRLEPVEHIGWIMNVLWHICCYLDWSKLTHNAISPDTFFISPLRHSGMLLGGWWYATAVGSPLSALPDRSMDMIPRDILTVKEADRRADLEMVRAIGRELLGDPLSRSEDTDESVHERINTWLSRPSLGRAIADYRDWKYELLEDCFGEPRFVPMNLTTTNLYKEV